MIVVDYSSKFEDTYTILNPLLMVYNTENRATRQESPEK